MRTSITIALLALLAISASCNKTKDWICFCTDRGGGGGTEKYYYTGMKKDDAKTRCSAMETTNYVENCKLD